MSLLRKGVGITMSAFLIIGVASAFTYDWEQAIRYAGKWYKRPGNEAFFLNWENYSWDNCANFVSQCVIAGGFDLKDGPGYDNSLYPSDPARVRHCIIRCGGVTGYEGLYEHFQYVRGITPILVEWKSTPEWKEFNADIYQGA